MQKCRNVRLVKVELLEEHLIVDGFLESYTRWIFHGEISFASVSRDNESSDSSLGDEIQEMLHDAFGIPPPSPIYGMSSGELERDNREGPDQATEKLAHKPNRVEESHWRSLAYYWSTPKAQLDMDELVSQMPESSMQSSSAVDEVFTQVMGPERPGCVRTYGFGPSPRDVFGHKKSEEMQAMQSQLDEQLSRHKAEMEAKQLEMEAQQAQMEKQMSHMEAKFEAQQRQFEVFLVQMRAMGMPITEPARKKHRSISG
ncbi:unnamed protein product [Ilex paraguariensis]|uniref:Transposase-associated domain-containing protein n=1 Tax=Ilex paraguariensis TaxID=185542 RepID=A0ABC8S8L1_9AQUA